MQRRVDFIKKEDFKQITNKALELNRKVPNEDEHTTFLAIDFGICEENGKIIPKLIQKRPILGHNQTYLIQILVLAYSEGSMPYVSTKHLEKQAALLKPESNAISEILPL